MHEEPVEIEIARNSHLIQSHPDRLQEHAATGWTLNDGSGRILWLTEPGIEPAVPISMISLNSTPPVNSEPYPWEEPDFPENPAKILRALRDHGMPMNRAMLTKYTNIENPGQIFHHPNPRVQAIARAYIRQPRRGLYAFNSAATDGAFELKRSGKNFERTLK